MGIAPNHVLLGKATDRSFRHFVEDMLEILTRNLNPSSGWDDPTPSMFSRQDVVQIIVQLVLNAAPSSDQSVRHKRYARGLVLWATLLKTISEYEEEVIERASLRWPVALRRRFAAGLRYGTQRHWPYSPYRARLGGWKPWEYTEVTILYNLNKAKRRHPVIDGQQKRQPLESLTIREPR